MTRFYTFLIFLCGISVRFDPTKSWRKISSNNAIHNYEKYRNLTGILSFISTQHKPVAEVFMGSDARGRGGAATKGGAITPAHC